MTEKPRLLRQRVFAGLFVLAFAAVQANWWLDARRYRGWFEPTPVLGPLYFLVNSCDTDEWLGVLLTVLLAPCILAWPIWPNRWTRGLAALGVLLWVGPGLFMLWSRVP